MNSKFKDISVVLATDCGSTTTKAILFEKTPDGWRQTFRGEAPTTVEKPVADVTIGAKNAFLEVQELSGRKILKDSNLENKTAENENPLLFRSNLTDKDGIDLYVSTSSAGGGLQMIVAGVVSSITTESAERAALGAGAIVMDTISIDDGREMHERVQKIRHLRPDIVLLSGGTDGGTVDHPLELAETLLQADPRPRFGETLKLPVIYSGNKNAAKDVKNLLEKHFAYSEVENIRPTLEKENLTPARDAIHEIFLEHVMSHAPGYKKLLSYSPVPIIPTPAAVGEMVLRAAKRWNIQILAVDIGGATTDVFSVFRAEPESEPVFNRTVSANLGMSYSVANVLLEAGEKSILRWLPFPISADELRDRLRNKMIRPTSIPYTLEDLLLEQAVCREALRLAFLHHKRLAVGLKGSQKTRTIGEMFKQSSSDSLVKMMELDLIIGSGGVLSHAPDRKSTAMMLVDAYEPEGVTRLAVDSIFMMPHLGVLSSVNEEAAAEVFVKDCLVMLGTVIAPTGNIKPGKPALKVLVEGLEETTVLGDEIVRLELLDCREVSATITPLDSNLDVGAGKGKKLECKVVGGEAGIIIDARGRALRFPNAENYHEQIYAWYQAFGLNIKEQA
jgi:uncharacterized protein (TIGR01319 family)